MAGAFGRDRGHGALAANVLVRYAYLTKSDLGEAFDVLAPYRGLGAQIPEIDGDLVRYRPESADLVTLDIVTREAPPDAVDALTLVRAAGRVGWRVRSTHERLSRFRPLGLGLAVPVEDCPERIVDWADLIVLTQFFDGEKPAVSGTVSVNHLRAAAAAVREDPAATRERLDAYARLFQLTLEEGP